MKFTAALTLAMAAAGINAHCIMQKISINGAEQGTGTAIRLPTSNNPITNVNDGNIACNANQGTASKTLDIKAGDKIGGWFGHVMGGAQGSNDPDHPIAKSHKGPVIVYLAKVNSASSTGTSGLQWTKIYADGLDGSGKWGVDRMISSGGWVYFNIPSCIPAGQYLMRIEIIALHNAGSQGGAQFYMSCAQVNISGGGSKTGSTMTLPGGYKSSDPGITVNIYDSKGQPTGGGRAYTIPGPAVLQC